jgi:ribonuclease HII
VKYPHFEFEQEQWKKGKLYVVGCDEVGRGSLAGPVVTAAVAFAPETKVEVHIDDSKKLTSKQREEASKWIKENALAYGVGIGSVTQINTRGIVEATNMAFLAALKKLNYEIDFVLMDAFYVPRLAREKQLAIVKGDQLSLSIAAASIIAKVYRDELMAQLSTKFNQYAWHQNKGYGTLIHRTAIKEHGVTKHHRSLFVRNLTNS